MLSAEERQEIEAHLARYELRHSAVIELLEIVQKHRGWVSDEGVQDTAEFLGMTPEEVDSVATFYSLIFRKPVGRHVILLCDSVSCWIMGYETIYTHLSGRLGIEFGETTSDGRFTLLPVACLGACDHAPAIMIDEELFGDLDAEKIDRILEGYV